MMPLTASRSALVTPPMTMSTLSRLTSWPATLADVAGSLAPSTTTSSSCRPSTPPAALISSTVNCAMAWLALPTTPNAPVRSVRAPILIGPLAPAAPPPPPPEPQPASRPPPNARPAPPTANRLSASRRVKSSMLMSPSLLFSGISTHETARPQPHEDDRREDHDHLGEDGARPGRQQGGRDADGDGAEKGSLQRPQPAYHDGDEHRDQVVEPEVRIQRLQGH